MAALECADLVVVSAVDTGTSWILNDAPHFSRPTQITSSRDSFPHSFCRLHFPSIVPIIAKLRGSKKDLVIRYRARGRGYVGSKLSTRNPRIEKQDVSCSLPRDPMAFADTLPHRMVINPRKDLADARIERCELSGLRVDTPGPRSYWKHNWLS